MYDWGDYEPPKEMQAARSNGWIIALGLFAFAFGLVVGVSAVAMLNLGHREAIAFAAASGIATLLFFARTIWLIRKGKKLPDSLIATATKSGGSLDASA